MENNIEKFREFLEATWSYKAPEKRVFGGWTGKRVAIMYREMLLGRPLTKEEKDAMEDGAYTISSVEGLKFLGLHDSYKEYGVYGIKIDGDYFIENWEGGLRIDHKKISKEEMDEMVEECGGDPI